MVIFLDTSTLVKLYYNEPDSQEILDIITQKGKKIFLFEIAKVEFTSAIWKKVRTGDLDKEIAIKVMDCFENDYEKYHWIYATSAIIDASKKLFVKYGLTSLRTLDALQLSACLSVKSLADVFLTNDYFLKELFEKEGLTTTLD